MNQPTDDRLLDYALGILSNEHRTDFEAELQTNAELGSSLHELREALTPLDERAPPASFSFEALVPGFKRFLPFVDELSAWFDTTPEAMCDILKLWERRDEPSLWQSAAPGVHYVHFPAGPRLEHADTGLVHFAAGATFPNHRHHQRELTYVLQGVLTSSDGQRLLPGDYALLNGGAHSVHAEEGEVLYATFHEGMTVEDAD